MRKKERRIRFYVGGFTGTALCIMAMLVLSSAVLLMYIWYIRAYDPLYEQIEEDPCYENGVYEIYDSGDYIRFVGYLNRARRERPGDNAATAVDAVLMADIDLSEAAYGPVKECPFYQKDVIRYHSMREHPYIRQGILNYAGTFDGNGHTIHWYQDSGNGMFICMERGAVVKNLTFCADSLYCDMDEYGVGMICMVNYGTVRNCRTKGSMEGTECYTGGIAGMNRGTIKGCVNEADILLIGVGEYGAGGIAGLNKCEVLEGESEENPIVPVIDNCINKGMILAPWEAGGICARNDCADIISCGNEGAVTVQYQRGYIYPEHPDWYERALAAGICGSMGWNSIENCYNTGKISILEDGEEATYGIAGGTLMWSNSVTGCVSLEGTATGYMRHERVMELDEETFRRWKEDPDSVPYQAANWQFDLEEAKEKLPLVPLGVAQSPASQSREDLWICSEFCLQAPEGYSIREVSPYALCMEPEVSDSYSGQIWILRLRDNLVSLTDHLDEEGNFTKDTAHELWTGIPGSHWLHPGYSYKDDCHVEYTFYMTGSRKLSPGLSVLHYRDDYLAGLAVGTEDGHMTDNIAVLPITGTPEGDHARWLLLFTRKEDNYRPPIGLARSVLRGLYLFPAATTIEKGDTLSRIAYQCTGDASRYPELAACNNLSSPDYIEAGQILTLPADWIGIAASDEIMP